MKHYIQAACGCNMGKVRHNNEDNFFFCGQYLEAENTGLEKQITIEGRQKKGLRFAVFDGMGGANFGEFAAYAAAKRMKEKSTSVKVLIAPEKKTLEQMALELNEAVVQAQKEMYTELMGTTMVSLSFSGRYAYVCNVGDSRAYRLRGGELLQVSLDHIEKNYREGTKKALLTQHLGIYPEEMQIEPCIVRERIVKGDVYLLCSDGLTDMLTDFEISDIMQKCENAESCVEELIQRALKHGGRDNITVIVCRLI